MRGGLTRLDENSRSAPQVGVLAELCLFAPRKTQVSEYRDLWHQAMFVAHRASA
jgi:hypothetical protein